MPSLRGPLIVERRSAEEEADTWTVYPTAGICIKFKEAHFPAASSISGPSSSKFFVNLAHCTELPAPQRYAELGEEQVAQLLDDDPDAFRIPICVGELDRSVEDNSGEAVTKVDVLVNSEFFHKRISESEFFRQLTIRIVCEAIQSKHSIRVDIAKQIILRNKKCVGELCPQRIRKKPAAIATTTTASSTALAANVKTDGKVTAQIGAEGEEKLEQEMADGRMDIDSIEADGEERKPRNFKVQIVDGKCVDVRVRTRDQQGELVKELDRITLKMNDDRIVVIVDGCAKCADFFLPFQIKDDQMEAFFDADSATLRVKCPIEWN